MVGAVYRFRLDKKKSLPGKEALDPGRLDDSFRRRPESSQVVSASPWLSVPDIRKIPRAIKRVKRSSHLFYSDVILRNITIYTIIAILPIEKSLLSMGKNAGNFSYFAKPKRTAPAVVTRAPRRTRRAAGLPGSFSLKT
jgi:hypothetical protein